MAVGQKGALGALLGAAFAVVCASSACDVTSGLHVPDREGAAGPNAPNGPNGPGGPGGPSGPGADGGASPTGDAAAGTTDGGVGPTDDGGGSVDAAADVESLCPVNPCTGGNVCCYIAKSANSGAFECMPGCPGGAPPVACAGPQQCQGATPYCCANVTLGAGSAPNCPIDAVSSACTDSCATSLGPGCGYNDTFRMCRVNADCATDPESHVCCIYPGTGFTSLVCVSDFVRSALGLQCSSQ